MRPLKTLSCILTHRYATLRRLSKIETQRQNCVIMTDHFQMKYWLKANLKIVVQFKFRKNQFTQFLENQTRPKKKI